MKIINNNIFVKGGSIFVDSILLMTFAVESTVFVSINRIMTYVITFIDFTCAITIH